VSPQWLTEIAKHKDPRIITALHDLCAWEILTQDNFDVIAKHQNPWDFAKALAGLKQGNVLDALICSADVVSSIIANHQNPGEAATQLIRIQKQLTAEFFRQPTSNISGFFSRKTRSANMSTLPMVFFLEETYLNNGGSQKRCIELFSNVKNFQEGISALQNRWWNDKKKKKSGATYLTLLVMGQLPSDQPTPAPATQQARIITRWIN